MSDNEAIEENIEVPLTKQKKPRSQAQIEAFEKVKEKRKANLEAKKQEKLLNSAKLLLQSSEANVEEPIKKPIKTKGKPQPPPQSESESEEEVIVVKKKARKAKKVRKIIIEESSSEEEPDDEEDEYEEYQPPKRTQHIRVVRSNPNDFFC